MTLEGAIKLTETTDYIIYTMNSVSTGQYGVVMPNNISGTLKMIVDLHMKSSFDSVSSGVKTKDQLVQELGDEYLKLKAKYADGMLLLPMIDENLFQNSVLNNDKQKMFDEVKKIGAITSELYKKLTDSGVEKQKIDQKIIIVEKNSDDEKFVLWLKEQMPNFVDGLPYRDLVEVVNPVTSNSNDLFGSALGESKVENIVSSTSGGIFDNIAPVATPVTLEEPVVSPVQSVVEEPKVENLSEVKIDVFGPSINETNNNNLENVVQTVTEEPPVVSVPPVAPVTESSTVVEEPKPVEGSALEGTMTFSAIPNTAETPTPNVVENSSEKVAENVENEAEVTSKGSKGFANLLILFVVLVGVTIASIELGKFLYSVYGA